MMERVQYRELPPAPGLRHLVRCYWTMERDYRLAAVPWESVWPDGKTELLFHTGDRYRLGGPDGSTVASGFLLGPLTRRLVLASPGSVNLVGVRFWPWGLAGMMRPSVDELTDRLVSVEDLWSVGGRRLMERLGEVGTEEAVRTLDDFLLARAQPLDPGLSSMAALADGIVRGAGHLRMRREAEQRNLSPRQLERRFKQVTGLSPKRLAVISRFDAARRHLLAHPLDDLSDIAVRFLYFDYAHLSKDFARFLGTTPQALRNSIVAARAAVPPTSFSYMNPRWRPQ